MRRLLVSGICLVFMGLIGARVGRANDIVPQDYLTNVNGTQYYDTFSGSGLNTAGFDTTTGLGTLTLTFNPGPGNYYVDAYFNMDLATPFFNEYGTAVGSPSAGQTWQIDDPIYGTIFGNAQNDTLDNTNHIPGQVDNYDGSCSRPNCNGDVSWAMGFDFSLAAGEEEVITLNLLQTQPSGGFYLVQTHPADPNNAGPTYVYFSGNASTQTVGASETNTWVLLLICCLALAALRLRRSKLRLGRW